LVNITPQSNRRRSRPIDGLLAVEVSMSKCELWFMRRVIKKQVIQGDHKRRIFNLYAMIVDAARDEFTEDNKPTLDGFLKEIHQDALDS